MSSSIVHNKSLFDFWSSQPEPNIRYINSDEHNGWQIQFYWDDDCDTRYSDKRSHVFIYYVKVNKQRQGTFTAFINQLINTPTIKTIGVLAVGSVAMENCLNKIGEFVCKGGDFIYTKNDVKHL